MRFILFLFTLLAIFPISVYGESNVVRLPQPRYSSDVSVEKALLERRSVRSYKDEPLTLSEISQLLWAAQGITEKRMGFRTAPSAGALYPLEIYVVAGKVMNLSQGVYRYRPENHELIQTMTGDKRVELYNAALRQDCIKNAPVVIVISAVFERTTKKYGERGIRYVHMEAGHCAQNIYLQCVVLRLGTVTVGAFDDEAVKKILDLEKNETPLYLMPIGRI